jgi:hypothetical protein
MQFADKRLWKNQEKHGAETQKYPAGKCGCRRLLAGRRIYSTAGSITHDDCTMIRALPIDARGGPKAHHIGAQYMSGSAYATTPIQKTFCTEHQQI